MIPMMVFTFFAALTVVCSVLLIVQKNPMHSVLYLAFTVLAIAGVFFTLQADFVGAIQLLVYAGGIVVLYLFVIIIINLNQMKAERRKLFPTLFLVAVPVLALVELCYVIFGRGIEHGPEGQVAITLPQLSGELLTTYLIPFEISSILLLAVLIGAIIIARPGARS